MKQLKEIPKYHTIWNLREKEYTMFIDEKVDEMLKARKKMGNGSVLGKIFGKIFD